MKRLAGILIAAVVVLWARPPVADPEHAAGPTLLALGFVLIAAWAVSDLLRRLDLPRVTIFLLLGMIAGPFAGNVITEPMAAHLNLVVGLATTLIALMAGLMLNVQRLGTRVAGVVWLTATTVGAVVGVVTLVAWVLWPWLPIAPETTGLPRLLMALLLGLVAGTFSPTMTAAVTAEAGMRGRLGELVLAIVVLADFVLLVAFSLAMLVTRTTMGSPVEGVGLVAQFLWQVGGAVAFGVLAGALFALYMRYVARQVTLAVVALCLLLTQVGRTQAFEPLLAAVTAGLVIENLAIAQGDALRAAIRRGADPVLVLFFVAVGTSLRLDLLGSIGLAALVLSVSRLEAIRWGLRLGARVSGLGAERVRYAWTGLISQAGITLGFASTVAAEYPTWGSRVQTLIASLIALHELVGPLLFRRGLARAGELEAPADRPLLVVSNREPYLHKHGPDGTIVTEAATGGVAVALDALMRERGGVWIAHGAGDADALVVDAHDKVLVPPDAQAYRLRRLWIERDIFAAYYGGLANEGLWPLCHQVDVRPSFQRDQWEAYKTVNAQFAAAVDQELIMAPETPVFIQDYHLALLAPALRATRPDVRTALFWHIPWPYPDRLRICPWSQELVAGLLANDLLAFQLERDRRNFLLAAEEELGADVEAESSRVTFGGRSTTVISVPIGVDFDRIQMIAADPGTPHEQDRLRTIFDLRPAIVGVGVDRLDYTKGIPERLAALELLVRRRPELVGQMTFVQVGVPSRSELESYAAIESEIVHQVADLNARYSRPGAAPLVQFYRTPLSLSSLVALYQLATFCIVSSLHDGMNLVAKEFVASRHDEDGVLVLSALTGAAQELEDALIINPYDVDAFADALLAAIDMPARERQRRMRGMRRAVAGRDVFLWASDILQGLESIWTKPLRYGVRHWEEMAV